RLAQAGENPASRGSIDSPAQRSRATARTFRRDRDGPERSGVDQARVYVTGPQGPQAPYFTTFNCGRPGFPPPLLPPPSSAEVGRLGGSGPRSDSENTMPSPVSRA